MVRSFLTHLVDSAARVVLLALCLLICLACATPFPTESLKEGMTAETVRENFGTPEAIETKPGGVESSWTYLHEELEPLPLTVGPMPLRVAVSSIWGVPLLWFFAFLDLISDELTGENWNHSYVSRAPVVLQFEGEKLVRWEVLPDIRDSFDTGSGYSEYASQQSLFGWMKQQQQQRDWDYQQRIKDLKHHKKGHKHHHGHGC